MWTDSSLSPRKVPSLTQVRRGFPFEFCPLTAFLDSRPASLTIRFLDGIHPRSSESPSRSWRYSVTGKECYRPNQLRSLAVPLCDSLCVSALAQERSLTT